MPIDVATLSDEKLETLVENHRRKAVTEGALYVAVLAELGRRSGRGLNFKTDRSYPVEACSPSR